MKKPEIVSYIVIGEIVSLQNILGKFAEGKRINIKPKLPWWSYLAGAIAPLPLKPLTLSGVTHTIGVVIDSMDAAGIK